MLLKVSNEVVRDINILRALYKVRVLNECNRSLIITARINSLVILTYIASKSYISQDLSNPLALLYYKAYSYILCLYNNSRNNSLFTAPLKD